jgi:hypothetical protein
LTITQEIRSYCPFYTEEKLRLIEVNCTAKVMELVISRVGIQTQVD